MLRSCAVLAFLAIRSVAQTASVAPTVAPTPIPTPSLCKYRLGDQGYPSDDDWRRDLPGVEKSPPITGNQTRPDWLILARKAEDVQNAVKFAGKWNVRLTIINSGHDFLGRNDATSGVWLSVANLKGVRVSDGYVPSSKGVASVDYSAHPVISANRIDVAPGSSPAVTFGAGVSSQELNDALDKSKLFTMTAAAPSVRPAGGYAQTAGHGPFTSKYGLAADNVLEFKVVTADGQLKVANSQNERELFWALRGGGGGTFGVVVEATMRAFPSPSVTSMKWWISTAQANDTDSIYEPAAYLHSTFQYLNNRGVQGYYFIYPSRMLGRFVVAGDDADLAKAKELWDPVLAGLSAFPGIKKEIHQYRSYPTYKAWFDKTFGAAYPRDTSAEENAGSISELEDVYPQGIAPLDSRLLTADHISSKAFTKALKDAMPKLPAATLRGHLVAGGRVATGGRDTSVHPAWRRSLVHIVASGSGFPDATSLKRLARDTGCYANECSFREPNYKQSMWGSNYGGLYALKTRLDPARIFWVTPGVGADDLLWSKGRLCRSPGTLENASAGTGKGQRPAGVTESPLGLPPESDNRNYRGGGDSTSSYQSFPNSQEEADNMP